MKRNASLQNLLQGLDQVEKALEGINYHPNESGAIASMIGSIRNLAINSPILPDEPPPPAVEPETEAEAEAAPAEAAKPSEVK